MTGSLPQNNRQYDTSSLFKDNRGRLPERHDYLSVLAAFTTQMIYTAELQQIHTECNCRAIPYDMGRLCVDIESSSRMDA